MKPKSKLIMKTVLVVVIWISALIIGKMAGAFIVGEAAEQELAASFISSAILYFFVIIILLLLIKIIKLDSVAKDLWIINFRMGLFPLLALFICFAGDIYLFFKYVNLIASQGFLNENKLVFSGPFSLFLALFVYIAVGFSEELCFRGILLKFWSSHYTDNNNGRIKAAFITSMLFGLIHLVNLSNGLNAANVIYTLTQILFATMYGMFFSAILYKTNSIWLCGLIHGMINFIGNISDIFIPKHVLDSVPTGILTDYSRLESIITVLVISPGFFWAIHFMLRKYTKK